MVVWLAVAVPALADPPRVDIHGDPLPDRALARFGTVRFRLGHPKVVALSADGKLLAAEDDSRLTIWDTATGRATSRLPVPETGPAIGLAFSPDGKQLAHLSGDRLTLLDVRTGAAKWTLPALGRAVGFQPGTGRLILVEEKCVSVVNPADGTPAGVDTEDPVCRLSPSGRFLLGTYSLGMHLVDAATGRQRCRFDVDGEDEDLIRRAGEPGDVTVALSPDDRRLYAITPAGRLHVFDAETGKRLNDLAPPPGWDGESYAPRLALSPDGTVAYLDRPGHVTYRRDLKAGKWLAPIPRGVNGPVLPHPDGRRLFMIDSDGVLLRYDLGTCREILDPLGLDQGPAAVPSPDGRRVAVSSGGEIGRLDLFDIAGRHRWSVPVGELPGRPRWAPDGRAVACAGNRAVVVCEAATGKILHRFPCPDPARDFTGLIAFTLEGRLIASLENGHALAEFDLRGGGKPRRLEPDVRFAMDMSPDGRTVAFTNGSVSPALFDVPSGRMRVGWMFPPPPVRGCGVGGNVGDRADARFSPDGSHLLTFTDGLGLLWDPVTGELQRSFKIDREPSAFDFSADGLWLAIGTDEGSVSLWDVPTGKRMVEWEVHGAGIADVAFAGPGRLVTSSDDTTALLLDLRPRKPLTMNVWDALNNDDDPAEAYRAVWALATDPAGPALLRKKIAPTRPAPAGALNDLIAQLGADRYRVREEAVNTLVEFGRRIEPELWTARRAAKSEEVRTRLDAVLAKIPRDRTWPEVVEARAVAAMELARTPEARMLLAEWAAGAPGARLTADAKVALGRLGFR